MRTLSAWPWRALGGQQARLADDFVGGEADDAALLAAAAAHRERLPGARCPYAITQTY